MQAACRRDGWLNGVTGKFHRCHAYFWADQQPMVDGQEVSNAVAFAGSGLVLKSDGTVAGWDQSSPPIGLSNVINVSAETLIIWRSRAMARPSLGMVKHLCYPD